MVMRSNPPWTEKILAKHWAKLEALAGAKWMPVSLTEPHRYAGVTVEDL